jgi:transposase
MDVSGPPRGKDSLDAVIFTPAIPENPAHQKFTNDMKGFKKLLKWVTEKNVLQNCLFCLDDTGNYSFGLSCFLADHQAFVCVESAYRIKHSMGIQWGKSDPADAEMIARYAYRFADDLSPFVTPTAAVAQLKALTSFRIRLIKQKTRLAVAITEIKQLKGFVDISFMISSLNKQFKAIKEQIKLCDQEIEQVIHYDQQLHHQALLLLSIPGIGHVITAHVLAYTTIIREDTLPPKNTSAPSTSTTGTEARNTTVSRQQRSLLYFMSWYPASLSRTATPSSFTEAVMVFLVWKGRPNPNVLIKPAK